MRDFFAWEYTGKYKDLKAAYLQLPNYKDDLGNPPLLIVSDLDRIEIRTNFTSLSPVLTTITLDEAKTVREIKTRTEPTMATRSSGSHRLK